MIRCFLMEQEIHSKATQQINPQCNSAEPLYPVKTVTEIKASGDPHLKETPLRQSTS